MSRRDRRRVQPRVPGELEKRRLLTMALISGNVGQIVQSQFQPFGFTSTVGTQLQGVTLRGPVTINVDSPGSSTGAGQGSSANPINSGLINHAQFNGGGFRTVGLQFKHVKIGGGLRVHGSDNEAPSSSTATASGVSSALTTVVNKNLISNSQFNGRGFGVLDRNPDGSVVGGEGRVGFQWRNTRVGGSVDVGVDVDIIQPGSTSAATAGSGVSAAAVPGTTVIDPTTNTGRIRNSQVNDGGFGDIGFQWSNVSVGGRVATSSNTLFIKPTQPNGAPITVQDRVFGQGTSAAATPFSKIQAKATVQASDIPSTETNAATNSGRILNSQFNDGGFGDVGLQWKNVKVRGALTAVHNSLTVQPENAGQGLITVQNARFPAVPATTPRSPKKTYVRPADPAVVAQDGDPLTASLPTPTGPISPYFPTPLTGGGTVTLPYPGNFPLVNAATNSGLIQSSQFNAGGFGDDGLQWQHVRVGGHVKIVHNSLSVHPEGSQLAGITVGNVSYGPAVSTKVARNLAVLSSAVISAGTGGTVSAAAVGSGKVLSPPNDRALTNQQLASSGGTDVFLEWNAIVHHRGLVLVHNVIQISGVADQNGPITLSNIRFPFKVPNVPGVTVTSVPSSGTVSAAATHPVLINSSNNSGILRHSQFSAGGFGDDGLQWKNVSVGGSVEVVHNTLAVDATADLPAGDVSGPISISNITFNSGALRGGVSNRQNEIIVSPPDKFQRASSRPINLGHALPQDPTVANDTTNSGIMNGGQLAAGAANHALLQWQGVKARGKVRVIDNVLSISVLNRPAGPITISNVTFA